MEDTLVGIALKKADNLFDGAVADDNNKKAMVKAFGSGFIKGFVDTCAVTGAILFAKGLIKMISNK